MSDKSSLRKTQVQSSLFDPSCINNASELLYTINQFSNAGDRIELCFAFAQNRPDVALHSFATILNTNADRKIRALVLRSCGEILHPPTRREIVACQSQESRELLRFLAEEANGRNKYSSDLTQWAAATAIIQLSYDLTLLQNIELGALEEEPDRIIEKIVDRRLEQGRRLDRYNTRNGLSPDYKEYLEFWAYGPTKLFFSEPSYYCGDADIRNILAFLRIHGLTLAFDPSSNQQVQREAYSLTKQICEEYSTNKDPWLNRSLKRFVKSEYDDRAGLESLCQAINFQLKINSYGNLSNLTLDKLRQAKTEVEAYKAYVVALFETAITVCKYPVLASFINSDSTRHLSTIETQLSRINSTINELKQAQLKILTNSNLLNQAYDQVRNVDLALHIKICNSRNPDWLSSNHQDWSGEKRQLIELTPFFKYDKNQTETLAQCQQLIANLDSRRSELYKHCEQLEAQLKRMRDEYHEPAIFNSAIFLYFVWAIIIIVLLYLWWLVLPLSPIGAYIAFVRNRRRKEEINLKIKKLTEIRKSLLHYNWQQ